MAVVEDTKMTLQPFYTSIAQLYDYIFPVVPLQEAFIATEHTHGNNSAILDIGAGTGNLSHQLLSSFKRVDAIEPDEDMRALAQKKYPLEGLAFYDGTLLNFPPSVANSQYDAIVSLGNTLVHLEDIQQVAQFLQTAHNNIKAKGKIYLQIINYDRILDRSITSLPTIENDMVIFTREYSPRKDGRINFVTNLTDKATNTTIPNSIALLPLRPPQLITLLKDAGFNCINQFGSFQRAPFTPQSQPFIIEATKV